MNGIQNTRSNRSLSSDDASVDTSVDASAKTSYDAAMESHGNDQMHTGSKNERSRAFVFHHTCIAQLALSDNDSNNECGTANDMELSKEKENEKDTETVVKEDNEKYLGEDVEHDHYDRDDDQCNSSRSTRSSSPINSSLKFLSEAQPRRNSTSGSGSDSTNVVIGTKYFRIMLHMRQHCPLHPYIDPYKDIKKITIHSARKIMRRHFKNFPLVFNSVKTPTYTTNQLYCEKCYCYVCDVKASQCQRWNHHHCHATDAGLLGCKVWMPLRLHTRRALNRSKRIKSINGSVGDQSVELDDYPSDDYDDDLNSNQDGSNRDFKQDYQSYQSGDLLRVHDDDDSNYNSTADDCSGQEMVDRSESFSQYGSDRLTTALVCPSSNHVNCHKSKTPSTVSCCNLSPTISASYPLLSSSMSIATINTNSLQHQQSPSTNKVTHQKLVTNSFVPVSQLNSNNIQQISQSSKSFLHKSTVDASAEQCESDAQDKEANHKSPNSRKPRKLKARGRMKGKKLTRAPSNMGVESIQNAFPRKRGRPRKIQSSPFIQTLSLQQNFLKTPDSSQLNEVIQTRAVTNLLTTHHNSNTATTMDMGDENECNDDNNIARNSDCESSSSESLKIVSHFYSDCHSTAVNTNNNLRERNSSNMSRRRTRKRVQYLRKSSKPHSSKKKTLNDSDIDMNDDISETHTKTKQSRNRTKNVPLNKKCKRASAQKNLSKRSDEHVEMDPRNCKDTTDGDDDNASSESGSSKCSSIVIIFEKKRNC